MIYSKKRIFTGVIWSGIDKCAIIIAQLVVELILARYLDPSEYGIIGMSTIFITLGSLFSESGISSALIQKRDRSQLDYSTAFYFNLIVSTFFVLLTFFCAPLVAEYFSVPKLTLVLRTVSLSIIFNAASMVHKTKLSLDINFKKQAAISFLSILVSGTASILMAVNGYGVWALVTQILLQSIVSLALYFLVLKWVPQFAFSTKSFSLLFRFGSNLLFAGLLQNIYLNLYNLLIGKKMSINSLGLFSKANQFTLMPAMAITSVLQRVMFPFFSSHQEDNNKLFNLNILFTKMVCLTVFPIFIYLAIFAEPLVYFGLTIKWIALVPIVQVLSMAYLFQPIIVNNMVLLQVKNKTNIFLFVEVLTKIIGVIILLITISKGIIFLTFGLLLQLIIQLIITMFFTRLILKNKSLRQIKIIAYYLLIGMIFYFSINFIFKSFGYKLFLLFGTLFFVLCYTVFYLTFEKQTIKSVLGLINEKKNDL